MTLSSSHNPSGLGKKVALFFPNSNVDQAVEKTKALMLKSTLVAELAIPSKALENKEESKKKIAEWCHTLKMA